MPATELWLQASASSPIRQAITQRDPFVSRHQFRSPHNADYFALSVPRFAARAWLQINLLCVLGEVISEREADLVHGV